MRNQEEESKGSTSGEESEYESDIDSVKNDDNKSKSARVSSILYLSTNLVTARNLTLADIEIKNYVPLTIYDMESVYIDSVANIKWQYLLIDPRAEIRKAKKEGQMSTIVDYERITTLAELAQ
jgi:hypothetical protein